MGLTFVCRDVRSGCTFQIQCHVLAAASQLLVNSSHSHCVVMPPIKNVILMVILKTHSFSIKSNTY